MIALQQKQSISELVGAWFARLFGLQSYSRSACADYLVVTLENYEAAAALTNHIATAGVQDIIHRVPKRSNTQTSTQYRAAVGAAVSWSDCFALERETVEAQPDVALAGNLRRQRIRYAQIASADECANYTKTALDVEAAFTASTPASFAHLRSELAMVTDRVLYLLTVSAPKENMRGWLTLWTVLLMSAGLAALFAIYYAVWHTYAPNPGHGAFSPTESLFVVLFSGLVGGFVSVQQRLQEPTDVDALFKRIELEASGYSIVVSPLIGMIFACVLFVAMMSGFVTGGVFPQFACPVPDGRCGGHDLAAFAAGATPADTISWAKVTLWAFAAGFLERLVPDILTRLGTVATNAKP